ncbi:uncharacterized protein LOC116302861 [Actinia tenebrosa]|uniref:Uncharacterized protein LOC116302861 n=1 Tax=Actinia tenebrosa TaxID=6105 RepID=A0A6P8INP0_ACTTE|nr:uncharacterized protein LOC116302861 [Actinia tenebrosa]
MVRDLNREILKEIGAEPSKFSWNEQKMQRKPPAKRSYPETNTKQKEMAQKPKELPSSKEVLLQSRDSRKARPQTRSVTSGKKKKKNRSEGEQRVEVEERRAKLREQTRERVKRYREKKRQELIGNNHEDLKESSVTIPNPPAPVPSSTEKGFHNRMAKTRALKVIRNTLPGSPKKKAEILESLISSPRTRKILSEKEIVKTPEERKEDSALKALAADISEGIKQIKKSGSKDNRAALSAVKNLSFGRNVVKSRTQSSVSKLFNLGRGSISKAAKEREKQLHSLNRHDVQTQHK